MSDGTGVLRRRRHREASPDTRRFDGDPAADVADLAERLSDALRVGGDRLDAAARLAAHAVVARVGRRAALGFAHTVVALAGSTGSGKSSLFNALAGFEISPVGALRPTTGTPIACVWGQAAGPLLDMLEVPVRHRTERVSELEVGREEPLHGLVLLDLPDHDSREASHRLQVDRLVELVDVLVWVVDPQKYADQVIHQSYLRRLRGHEDVVVVVLNQMDTVAVDSAPAVRDDLRRLLDEDGLPNVDVIVTSARTGSGVDRLRDVIIEAVASRAMATIRARADLGEAMDALRKGVGDDEPAIDEMASHSQLVTALAEAASIRSVLAAIEGDYRRRAGLRTGWPPTRWIARFRPDPLRRIRVAAPELEPDLTALTRSSVAQPTPAQLARVDLAQRELVEWAASGLPTPWGNAVRAAPANTDDLRDGLDQAVMGTDLRFRDPTWWRVLGGLQLALLVLGLVGVLTLTGLALLVYLQFPAVPLPRAGGIPLPTLAAVGGIGGGVLVAAIAAAITPGRARARRTVAETRLVVAVAAVARERMLRPVADVLADHRHCRDLLTR